MADDPAVLDADAGDELSGLVNSLDVGRRVRDLDEVRVHLLGHAMDGGELVASRAAFAYAFPLSVRAPWPT